MSQAKILANQMDSLREELENDFSGGMEIEGTEKKALSSKFRVKMPLVYLPENPAITNMNGLSLAVILRMLQKLISVYRFVRLLKVISKFFCNK